MTPSPELKAARAALHRLKRLHVAGAVDEAAVARAGDEASRLEVLQRRLKYAVTVSRARNAGSRAVVMGLPGGGPAYRIAECGAFIVSNRWHYPVDGVVFVRSVLYDINHDGQPCNPRRAPLLPGTKTAFHLSKDNTTVYVWTPKATRAVARTLVNGEALGFKFTRATVK